MGFAEELERLDKLHREGVLNDEEYQKAKEAAINKENAASKGGALSNVSVDENQWAMFIHLSQLCGFVVPIAGLAVPIVLWQIKKNESAKIDLHGRIVTNWIITAFIAAVVCAILSVVIIGLLLLPILGVIAIVFAIIGAVKANNGEAWPYPMSIKFFPLEDAGAPTDADRP